MIITTQGVTSLPGFSAGGVIDYSRTAARTQGSCRPFQELIGGGQKCPRLWPLRICPANKHGIVQVLAPLLQSGYKNNSFLAAWNPPSKNAMNYSGLSYQTCTKTLVLLPLRISRAKTALNCIGFRASATKRTQNSLVFLP